MSYTVTVIDYGAGNLLNVACAFEYCGATVRVATTADQIKDAGLLVLPGVGAFADAMQELQCCDVVDQIVSHANSGKPLLGICLGMQMLLDASEEFGNHSGLSIIPGRVVPIPEIGANGKPHKIPHTGWNELLKDEFQEWSGTLLEGLPKDPSMYFVHSYMAEPTEKIHRLAYSDYDGCEISAVLKKDNVLGCQFHPEKSGEMGLQIIRGFLAQDM